MRTTGIRSALRVLCNGRRAFIGNNLYSKGACYTAYRKLFMHIENPVYYVRRTN